MTPILLASLLKIELPGRTVRMVDGGTIVWGGETYTARDELLGVPNSFEALTEGVGDEAPAGAITFLPPDASSAATLLAAGNQGARMRIWNADVDATTGQVIGTPEQQLDAIIDYPTLTIAMGKRELELAFVTGGDRLFQVNLGNSLSPTFHRGVHPGEAGLDNASGVSTSVAWGAAAAPRGTASSSAGGFGGGFGSVVNGVFGRQVSV